MAEKILVVDDDLDSLKLIGLLLQRQGYQVVAAPGGSQGLAQAESESPDLILLDIMMPEMDGYEVCKRLRRDPRLAHIPVIMFTAKTRVDDKVTGFEAGADDYLTKPTHPAELASRIKAVLTRTSTVQSAVIQRSHGKMIVVLGVRGGSGVTTMAVNLSLAMSQMERSVILAELQPGIGAIALQLGLPRPVGLSKLLQMRLNGLDQENLEKELVEYTPGMHLLLAEYNPTNAATPYPAAHIERIMALLPNLADLVVLDLGNRIGSNSLKAIGQADQILLCLAAQQTSLTMSQSLLESLKQTEACIDRTGIVVINTAPPSQPDIAHRIETQLQLPIIGHVSPALELAQASAEQEKPMILLQPESSTANQFRELAQRVATDLERLDR